MTANKIPTKPGNRIARFFVSIVMTGFAMLTGSVVANGSGIDMPQVTTLPGQSSTQMPDGRWLLIGGDVAKLRAQTQWLDTRVTPPRVESNVVSLKHSRAWHSATLLPNGTVLVFGGSDLNGDVVNSAELFDPLTKSFAELSTPGLKPRTRHATTLLTDGRVLITGGFDQQGNLIKQAQLWNPQTQTAEKFEAHLMTPRANHRSDLLPSEPVLLSGGVNSKGEPVDKSEWYDPEAQHFKPLSPDDENVLPLAPLSTYQPAVEATLPKHGETNVLISQILSVRFSKHLRMDSLTTDTVTLIGPLGEEAIKVVPAESGLLVFVTPQAQLLPGSYYTLFLRGATDTSGNSLPFTSIGFTTQTFTLQNSSSKSASNSGENDSDSSSGGISIEVHDDEEWHPLDQHKNGNWRSGNESVEAQNLPPLKADPGVTALAGQVILLNGKPLANVTLKIGDRSTMTDDTGRFLLSDITFGHQELFINGHTADQTNKTYGKFIVGVDIVAAQTNVLSYTLWMPKLDMKHAVNIPSPTSEEVVLITPDIPGLEVHIPPGAVIRDRSGNVVTNVSITAIPVDQPPYPLPAQVEVPVYFTIQPGDGFIQNISVTGARGARIIYPNYTKLPPGTRADFWHYDSREKGWHVYGQGAVNADGTQVVPDPEVSLYEFTGAMIGVITQTPPPDAPPPGGNCHKGDPVDCATGLFFYEHTDMVVRDIIPITIARTYRSNDTLSRRFGIGSNDIYGMFLYTQNPAVGAELILPDGGRIPYVLTAGTGGIGNADAVYENITGPTAFYKSRITLTLRGYVISLKDGTQYLLNNFGYITEISDRYGNRLIITRTGGTSNLNIARITSPSGRYVDFTYDARGHVAQLKDNLARTVNYVYDTSDRLSSVTDAAGGITEYTYDTNHRMLTVKNPRGIIEVTNEYDGNGRVFRQTHGDGGVYLFDYTLNGGNGITQTDVTDPRGDVERMVFNPWGYVVSFTSALGTADEQTTTFERERFSNRVLNKIDALNHKTSFVYDYLGNLRSLTKMAGTTAAVVTTFTYEPVYHQIASVTDPLNHTTNFSYDNSGNLITITDALSNTIQFGYNERGQRTSFTNALGKTTTLNYSLGDLVGVVDALNRETTLYTDDAGRVLRVTNPLGQTTRYDYNVLDRVTQVTDPLNGLTQLGYDGNNNLTSVLDPKNNATTFAYNARDQLQSNIDPLLNVESFVYDGNDNLTQSTDRKNQITGRTYDARNRLKTITFADSSVITYTYDKADRITQIADSLNGTLSYAYDDLLRTVTSTTAQGQIIYHFDTAGRRVSTSVAGQTSIAYAYDELNRLTSITQGSSVVNFSYDAASRLKTKTLPNGLSEEYGYDDADQLTSIKYKQGIVVLGDVTYSYDSAGQRIKIGGSYARQTMPLTQTTTAYNAANQLTNWNGISQTYDLNGNLINDGVKTYSWNARNQLIALVGGGVTASFQYDAAGRRVGKTINGVTTNFLYDGLNVIQELTGTTPKANLLPGLNLDEVFARTEGVNTSYYLTDALNSTLALTDTAGTLQTEYTYEPFGKMTQSGAANDSAYQYTGRENDGTGLMYYRARYYNPATQRFISSDPIGMAGGINSYAYVGNNPLSWIDPYGLAKLLPYDPGYSPTPGNCAHYPPGTLRDICQGTPNNPDMNCARKCLKDYWPGNYGGPWQDYIFWLIPQHPVCWYECNITPDDFCGE